MEEANFPSLEKTASVGTSLPAQADPSDKENSHFKVGSLPQLPPPNKSLPSQKLKIVRKFSCFSQYRDHTAESSEQREALYLKINDLLHEMIDNPSKISMLLSALHSMEHSIRSLRKSKNSQESKGSESLRMEGKTSTQSLQNSCESHPMSNSLQLECKEEELPTFKASHEICDFMAESIEIEYPYIDTITGDKTSAIESEELKNSCNSGVRSIEEEMLGSIHIPSLTEVYKRMSIILIDQQENQSELFSSNASGQSLGHIDLPRLQLGLELITAFFSSASPFLINFTLSLLFKFFLKSKFQPSSDNIGWLLGVASLVGYKIYYDETLSGILDYFSEVLGLSSDEVGYLERWFLKELNYEVLINPKHYTEIMMKLLKNQ